MRTFVSSTTLILGGAFAPDRPDSALYVACADTSPGGAEPFAEVGQRTALREDAFFDDKHLCIPAYGDICLAPIRLHFLGKCQDVIPYCGVCDCHSVSVAEWGESATLLFGMCIPTDEPKTAKSKKSSLQTVFIAFCFRCARRQNAMKTIIYWYANRKSTDIGLTDAELLGEEFEREKTVVILRLQGAGWTEIGRRHKLSRHIPQLIAKRGLRLIAREKLLRELDRDPEMPVNLALTRVQDVFCAKTAGLLERTGKDRVGDLYGKTDAELLKYRDLGKKALREIRALLERFGR